jgi:N-acetylglucosamine-6-sulfatase
VIANQSIGWINEMHAAGEKKPYFAYIAVKAPHIQDGAGWPVTLAAPWCVLALRAQPLSSKIKGI